MGAWLGLGMNFIEPNTETIMTNNKAGIDECISRGINNIRIHISDYQSDTQMANDKELALYAVSKGGYVIWGVSSNRFNNSAYKITTENWSKDLSGTIDSSADTTHLVDDALTGANDYINGCYFYNVTRSSGSVITDFDADTDTVTLGVAISGMVAGDSYTIKGFHESVLDAAAWAQANGISEFQTGNEEEYHNADPVEDITDPEIRANTLTLATAVQPVFTRGPVSCTSFNEKISSWITLGKGDLDILAFNVYDSQIWKQNMTDAINEFGADGTYITEFNLHTTSLASYSSNEEKQAVALANMINNIKETGVTKACYFTFYSTNFGAKVPATGDYRLLWNNLTTNNGRRWFINV